MKETYICIDLKSFYASNECVYRNLNPLTTNLVVADISRTEKTICLAISPSLKEYGLKGRARLFEVISKVNEVNEERRKKIKGHSFIGTSIDSNVLNKNHDIKVDFIIAPPRMKEYIKTSSHIYSIYLRYVSKEDIHVYSIDEVFIDVTRYLKTYKMDAYTLAKTMIKDILNETGITATCGIGTNLYLAKVGMDILAKHTKPDNDGVRIAYLDEKIYREKLWDHTPLTDFWRVGKGIERRLNKMSLYTMGDIALACTDNEKKRNIDSLFKEFGINAEILIDHAFGYEPTKISDIKNYKPVSNSISEGQVIHCPYSFSDAKILVSEMIENLSNKLVEKNMMTSLLHLTIGYDTSNLKDGYIKESYQDKIERDHYGRENIKSATGSIRLDKYTSSSRIMEQRILSLYESIVDRRLLIRRINVTACDVLDVEIAKNKNQSPIQISLFEDSEKSILNEKKEKREEEKDLNIQKTIINIKKKYGKNSILKGRDFLEKATQRERNEEIGGHKA